MDDIAIVGSSGRPVVLLPGGVESAAGYFPGLADGLAAAPGCRVVLYDRPGTGASRQPGRLADAAAAVRDALAGTTTQPAVLVGHSLGGAVAALLARDHPEVVAGLVLIDPTPINDHRVCWWTERSFRVAAAAMAVPGIRGLPPRVVRSAVERRRREHQRPDTADAWVALATADLRATDRGLRGLADLAAQFDTTSLPAVPTMVISADHAPRARIGLAHRALAAGFGGSIVSWPGTSQWLHLERPDDILAAVRQFLQSLPPPASLPHPYTGRTS